MGKKSAVIEVLSASNTDEIDAELRRLDHQKERRRLALADCAEHNQKLLLQAVVKRVRSQMVSETPESRLFFAVFEQAVFDYFSPCGAANKSSAYAYLASSMPHLWACGIDSSWVRVVFNRHGLPFPRRKYAK